jgi:hypothetical protein
MPKLTDLQRTADYLGVSLAETGESVEAYAPPGVVFIANGAHAYLCTYQMTEVPWPQRPRLVKGATEAARVTMADALALGVTPCTLKDCDTCNGY